jgi:hypothetical protein
MSGYQKILQKYCKEVYINSMNSRPCVLPIPSHFEDEEEILSPFCIHNRTKEIVRAMSKGKK